METNIILAGVGGQGILSISMVLDHAAIAKGWHFKQAEVHGMSQRGGGVESHLRISDVPIHSELVPAGALDLVLGVEPVEALRFVPMLSPRGVLVTGSEPFLNIDNYPAMAAVIAAVAKVPKHVVLPGERIAREAGSAKAQNIVLLGAASAYLPFSNEELERAISATFAAKGERMQKRNVEAFRAGAAAADAYRHCLEVGIPSRAALALAGRLAKGVLAPDAVAPWKATLTGPRAAEIVAALEAEGMSRVRGTADVARAVQSPDGGALQEVLFH